VPETRVRAFTRAMALDDLDQAPRKVRARWGFPAAERPGRGGPGT